MDKTPPRTLSDVRTRSLLLSLQIELGRGGLNFLLRQAGVARLINGLDAEDLTLRLPVTDYVAVLQAAENYFGQTGPALLRRVGRGTLRQLMRYRPMATSWYPVLALTSRLNAQLAVLRWLAEELADTQGKVTVEAQAQHLVLTHEHSDEAYGRHRDTPVCYCTLGMIEEVARWTRGNLDAVTEQTCQAQGAPACRFVIYAQATGPLWPGTGPLSPPNPSS